MTLNFDNPDELLDILLSTEKDDYDEVSAICSELLPLIGNKHKNLLSRDYPSALTQCILECYRIKNNFSQCFWQSSKLVASDNVKSGAIPITFSRIIASGEICSYELFNIEQLVNPEIIEKPLKLTKEKIVKEKVVIPHADVKNAILACVKEYDGLYGRGGIAKILKGSKAIKDNEFNNESINSKYYGVLDSLTKDGIVEVIDELINDTLIRVVKTGNFGRPVLKINTSDNYDLTISKKSIVNETKEDDENTIKILELLRAKKNIFITGHAGTGKSYILNKLKQNLKKDLTITSTTGIAAVNVKGQTLHSWAGVGICNRPVYQTVEKILQKSSTKRQIQKCKILAIDEISMLDIKTFEYVDEVLQQVRDDKRPFGGIQVIFIGDFFQLPPVNLEESERKYCFESFVWEQLELQPFVLTKNYRQSEENLIKALSNMRINALTSEDVKLLTSREFYEEDEGLSNILHIFATNKEADGYNNYKYSTIDRKEYKLLATDGFYKNEKFIQEATNDRELNILNRIDMVCNAEKCISLKLGARVMLLTNLDFEKGLINGSCGVVREIENNYVLVDFDNGYDAKIEKHDFEFYNNEVLVAKRQQFPLRLAYGITIHKSQGMSLDRLVVDCSRIFEKGQAYVALSRIKTLEGLYIRNFNPNKVMVDEKVVEFYSNLLK